MGDLPTPDPARREALERGARAERFVADQLVLDGWAVLARNWRGRGGELDLVVQRGGCVRFVEVKARSPEDPTGLEAITASKQRRLIRAAEGWLLEQEAPPEEACFLVAVVAFDRGGWSVEWLDDAFDGG